MTFSGVLSISYPTTFPKSSQCLALWTSSPIQALKGFPNSISSFLIIMEAAFPSSPTEQSILVFPWIGDQGETCSIAFPPCRFQTRIHLPSFGPNASSLVLLCGFYTQTCWSFCKFLIGFGIVSQCYAIKFRLPFDYVLWHHFRCFHIKMGNPPTSLPSQFFHSFTCTDLDPDTSASHTPLTLSPKLLCVNNSASLDTNISPS